MMLILFVLSVSSGEPGWSMSPASSSSSSSSSSSRERDVVDFYLRGREVSTIAFYDAECKEYKECEEYKGFGSSRGSQSL